jgi:hypothetical protein
MKTPAEIKSLSYPNKNFTAERAAITPTTMRIIKPEPSVNFDLLRGLFSEISIESLIV